MTTSPTVHSLTQRNKDKKYAGKRQIEKKKYKGGQNSETVFGMENTVLVEFSIWKTNLQTRQGIFDTERQLI